MATTSTAENNVKKETQVDTRLQNIKGDNRNAATAGYRTGEDSIFKQVEDTSSGSKTPILAPGGASNGGYIDVIRQFRWTPVELGDAAYDDIPYIYMKEFRSTRSGLDLVAAGRKLTASLGSGTDPYEGLYSFDDPTEFCYRFPYFSNTYYDISNQFESVNPVDMAKELAGAGKAGIDALKDLKNAKNGFLKKVGNLAGKASNFLGFAGEAASATESAAAIKNKMSGAAGGNDAGKLDMPMLWGNTSTRTISFKFYLFNTLNSTDIKRNWELIHLLRYQNVINKKSLVQAIPPVFYEVRIPGQHYTRGAYMSNFTVNSIGTTRRLDGAEAGGIYIDAVHVPDAWEVSITLTDFLKPSQNLLDDLLEDSKVSVSKKSSTAGGATTVSDKSKPEVKQ